MPSPTTQMKSLSHHSSDPRLSWPLQSPALCHQTQHLRTKHTIIRFNNLSKYIHMGRIEYISMQHIVQDR